MTALLLRSCGLGLALWLLSTPRAWGASSADGGESDGSPSDAGALEPDAVTPPRLVEEAQPVYPEDAGAAGIEGTVVLAITIDDAGVVTDAVVEQALGHGLDEAALAAARRSRFTPALRGGRPIAARIRFACHFAAPRPPRPAPALPAPIAAPPPAPPEAISDVTIRGASAARRLRESAEAVTVVETKQAQSESADLGEVLARVPGLAVQRSGGLGSYARISLNGLTDDQIRYYMDGIPLDAAGFGLGLQNTPLAFVDRVEIYRGVVPARFGADALGGAINVVTLDDPRGTHGGGSLQLGSFGTTRATLAARRARPDSGLYTALSLFADHADNDYPVDVQVPDALGRLTVERVHLSHAAYSGYGGMADIGLVNRAWARRLLLRLFANRQDDDIPTNLVMTVPYGEARYGEVARGANLRYEAPHLAGSPVGATAIVAYSRNSTSFQDLSPWVYDWFGQQVRARTRPGEIGPPTDQTIWDDKVLARLWFTWAPRQGQEARLALAPTFDRRTGENREATAGHDPLAGLRRYLTVVAGGEYEVDPFQRRLQAITFVKGYLYRTWADQPLAGGGTQRLQQDSLTGGAGEEVRYRFRPALWAKASYERTTRFPSPDEVFGDGVWTIANLELRPERSHNANLSLTVDDWPTHAGAVRGELNVFFRQASDLIVPVPSTETTVYDNVNTALSQGLEASAGWTAPRGWLAIDGNATWQSLRNRSSTGQFGAFDGDRIPNRPWLFANASLRARRTALSAPGDELSLGCYLRYVHAYYRGWESLGLPQYKQVIPSQTTLDVVLTYATGGKLRQIWTLEADNLADAKVYDFYGVQRPGRAFYAKVVVEY